MLGADITQLAATCSHRQEHVLILLERGTGMGRRGH